MQMPILDNGATLKDALVSIETKAVQANTDRNRLEEILSSKSSDLTPGLKMNELIEKVKSEVEKNKKVATGSLTIKNTYIRPDSNNVNRTVYVANVSNLDFTPSRIYFYIQPPFGAIYEPILMCYLDLSLNSDEFYITYTDNQYTLYCKFKISDWPLLPNGFKMPVCLAGGTTQTITVKWVAVE